MAHSCNPSTAQEEKKKKNYFSSQMWWHIICNANSGRRISETGESQVQTQPGHFCNLANSISKLNKYIRSLGWSSVQCPVFNPQYCKKQKNTISYSCGDWEVQGQGTERSMSKEGSFPLSHHLLTVTSQSRRNEGPWVPHKRPLLIPSHLGLRFQRRSLGRGIGIHIINRLTAGPWDGRDSLWHLPSWSFKKLTCVLAERMAILTLHRDRTWPQQLFQPGVVNTQQWSWGRH